MLYIMLRTKEEAPTDRGENEEGKEEAMTLQQSIEKLESIAADLINVCNLMAAACDGTADLLDGLRGEEEGKETYKGYKIRRCECKEEIRKGLDWYIQELNPGSGIMYAEPLCYHYLSVEDAKEAIDAIDPLPGWTDQDKIRDARGRE